MHGQEDGAYQDRYAQPVLNTCDNALGIV